MTFEEFMNTDISVHYAGEDLGTFKPIDTLKVKTWVSSRASRLNEQDHVDFDAFARQAIANKGDAYLSCIYHAHVFLHDNNKYAVLITTIAEDESEVE